MKLTLKKNQFALIKKSLPSTYVPPPNNLIQLLCRVPGQPNQFMNLERMSWRSWPKTRSCLSLLWLFHQCFPRRRLHSRGKGPFKPIWHSRSTTTSIPTRHVMCQSRWDCFELTNVSLFLLSLFVVVWLLRSLLSLCSAPLFSCTCDFNNCSYLSILLNSTKRIGGRNHKQQGNLSMEMTKLKILMWRLYRWISQREFLGPTSCQKNRYHVWPLMNWMNLIFLKYFCLSLFTILQGTQFSLIQVNWVYKNILSCVLLPLREHHSVEQVNIKCYTAI